MIRGFLVLVILLGLFSPVRAEHWVVSKNGTWAKVTGRTPISLSKKLNPLWWVGNDHDPLPPMWYQPTLPQWERVALWYGRNPFQNFGWYVAGVADRNYKVHDPSGHVLANVPSDVGAVGCYHKEIIGAAPWPLYYMACTTPPFEWYAGWQPDGFFGFKFNIIGGPSLF